MSAQQFMDRRDSLTTLVSNNLFQNRASVGGSLKKGKLSRSELHEDSQRR